MNKDIQKITISKNDVSDLASSAVSLVSYLEEISQVLDVLLNDTITLGTAGAGTLAQLMACKEVVDNAASTATSLSFELEELMEG